MRYRSSAFAVVGALIWCASAGHAQVLPVRGARPAIQQETILVNGETYAAFPEALCYVQNVYTIKVTTTAITELPPCFANFGLTARDVEISGNSAISEVPDWISQFQGAKNISLKRNGIARLPGSVGDLRHVNVLDLSTNKLQSVPDSIGDISSLEVLDLSNNPLTVLPDSMAKLNGLQTLNLGGTSLTVAPKFLPYLVNLSELTLPDSLPAPEKQAVTLIFKGRPRPTIVYR